MSEKENNEREFVDGVDIVIKEVQAEPVFNEPERIKRIKFITTEDFDITFKPKTKEENYRKGIKVIEDSFCLFDDLPKKITEISDRITKEGKCPVVATYQKWNTEKDGKPVSYRYVHGTKMLDKWQIAPEKKVEEEEVK